MFESATFEIEAGSGGKGQLSRFQKAALEALSGGKLRLFCREADGSRTEVFISSADSDEGYIEFDPKDAKKDKHGPRKADRKSGDPVVFTISPSPVDSTV